MTAPRSPKRRRRGLFLVLAALLVLGGAGAFRAFKGRETPIVVQVEPVTRRNLTEVVAASGRIQPVVQVKISPEVSGEIIDLPVKEGQPVKKGDLLVRIKPDFYAASRRSAEASFKSAEAGLSLAEANLRKAESEFQRNKELLANQLIAESVYTSFKTALDVSKASHRSAQHQVEVARAALDRAEEELSKTTIRSPIDGTVSRLNSQAGERVVGTAMMTGTEIMTIADLNAMEARVEIGEIDVVLIAVGQKARLEVEAFRDRKFAGTVTEIANSSRAGLASAAGGGGQSQEATRFEVRIRIEEQAAFRPGMSVTTDIETRSRTNVLTVPIQSVTTRLPKAGPGAGTNGAPAAAAPATASAKAGAKPDANGPDAAGSTAGKARNDTEGKAVEIVFLREGDTVRSAPVRRGISDENYTEIVDGLTEGQEVVSGGYKAISRDLEDGKKVVLGTPANPGTVSP